MSTVSYDSVASMRTSLDAGNGVIKCLLHVYTLMVKGPRPESFGKHTEKGVAKLVSRFGPGVATEKGSAIEDLILKAKTERPLLERLNNDLFKAAGWCKDVAKLIADLSPVLLKMQPDLHASATFDFMSLITLFCRVCFLASKIPGPERRALVAIPARIVGSTDERFNVLSEWVVKIDAPISYIQESLSSASGVIGQMMKGEACLGSIMTEALNSEKLRNDGVINLVVKPSELTTSSDDYLHYELAIAQFVRDWIYFGFIACPAVATEDGEAGFKKSLKPILEDNFVVHIAGGLTIPLHETLESAWANIKLKDSKAKKALSSQKKSFHECLNVAATKGFSRRKERRLFLMQELRGLYQIAKDSPGIVAPKFHMFLAALSLAKDEIMWYLRHVTDGPNYFVKKSEKDDWFDARVVELIYYQQKLEELVFQQNEDVALYYSDFFASVACDEMSKMASGIVALNDPEATTSASEMASLFNKLAANPEGIPDDLDTLDEIYEKSCVIDFAAARHGATESLSVQRELVRARVFGNAAYLVESLDLVLDKYSSIMGSWYFNEALYAVFKAHAQGETKAIGSPYAAVYIHLLEDFKRVPSSFWPEERPLVGEACVKWADKYCKAVTAAASKDIVQMVQYAQTFVANMSEMNALQFLERTTAPVQKGKEPEPVVRPGFESDLGNRDRVLRLRFANRNLRQLLAAFNSVTPITIYDTEIAPLSYLHDMLEELLTRFVRGAFDPRQSKDGELRRPTDIRNRLDAIFNTFSSLENACPLGIEQMWEKIFLNEFYDADVCRFGTMEATPIKEIVPKPVEDYVFMPNPSEAEKLPRAWDVTLEWYKNFVTNVMTSAADGKIIFSSALREFVTRQNLNPKEAEVIPIAENMTSYAELKALASIVGPYGIRIFDSILLKRISEEVVTMLKVVDTYKETLREINSNYSDEAKFIDLVRKVKGIDVFVRAAVQVGVAMQLRHIVKTALFSELEAQTPHLAAILTNAFESYPRNIRPDEKLFALDVMAADHGVSVDAADQPLKQAVKLAATSSGVNVDAWKNMHVMFGIMFLCAPWRDTHYIVSHRAYNNNLHLLAPVINNVIIALASMTAAGATQADTDVQDSFSLFVEIASLTLLRQQRIPVKSSTKSPDWAAITFFLDIFFDECTLIPRDVLEQCLPYTLLRNIVTELNRRPVEPGWQA